MTQPIAGIQILILTDQNAYIAELKWAMQLGCHGLNDRPEKQMNTNAELSLVAVEECEATEQSIELSLIELDVVSGGTAIGCTY